MLTTAMAYLEQDTLHHIDMLQPILRGTADILHADSEGVLLREQASGAYFLTANTPEAANRLIKSINSASLMVSHQAFACGEITRRLGLRSLMTCQQAAWLHPVPPHAPSPCTITPLAQDMSPLVQAHYSHSSISPAYIEGRIAAGEMFGAFLDGTLAGFVGLHEEGSMGMLEVLPGFRRMGVATQIFSHLCAVLLSKGWTPFSQFTTSNNASRKLHEALGFAISSKPVFWMEA